jgi:hypothetical protein
MRSTQEIIEFINEQQNFIDEILQEQGIKMSALSEVQKDKKIYCLEQKYWILEHVKYFAQGDI